MTILDDLRERIRAQTGDADNKAEWRHKTEKALSKVSAANSKLADIGQTRNSETFDRKREKLERLRDRQETAQTAASALAGTGLEDGGDATVPDAEIEALEAEFGRLDEEEEELLEERQEAAAATLAALREGVEPVVGAWQEARTARHEAAEVLALAAYGQGDGSGAYEAIGAAEEVETAARDELRWLAGRFAFVAANANGEVSERATILERALRQRLLRADPPSALAQVGMALRELLDRQRKQSSGVQELFLEGGPLEEVGPLTGSALIYRDSDGRQMPDPVRSA